MNLSQLEGDEKRFLHRLEDMLSSASGRTSFTPFLTSRQQVVAEEFIRQRHCGGCSMLYGGHAGAERRMLGFFPEYVEPDTALFPIQPITITYRQGDTLGHRDFLGACLGLLIKRESIGDILPGDGQCILFAQESVAGVILQELRKVKNYGVRCQPGLHGEIHIQQEFEEARGTISSPRIDCLVAELTNLSREKSAKLILAEKVQLNHMPVTSVSREFSEGDVVSIRGYGKYIADSIGAPTRKGRLPIVYRKYK